MNASKSIEHNSSTVGPVTLNKKPFADVHHFHNFIAQYLYVGCPTLLKQKF